MRSITTKSGEKAATDDGNSRQNSRPNNVADRSGAEKGSLRQLAREVMSEISALDPSSSEELLGIFVSELFLLAAEQRQRKTRSQRQSKAVAEAKARGVRFGPQPRPMPDGFEELRQAWRSKKIPLSVAAELCGVPRSTFYDAALRAEMDSNRTGTE